MTKVKWEIYRGLGLSIASLTFFWIKTLIFHDIRAIVSDLAARTNLFDSEAQVEISG